MQINGIFLILLLAAGINVVISFVVLYRNSKKAANLAFAVTSLTLTLWAVFNFLSTFVPSAATLPVTRVTGLLGLMFISAIYVLSTVFPNQLIPRKWLRNGLMLFGTIVGVLSLTPLLIASAVNTSDGLKLTEGVLYPLYPLYILTMFVLFNLNFIRQFRASGRHAKIQLQLMWTGVVMTVAFIALSNILMPAITDDWSSSEIGTVFTIPFVGLTAYAIIKRRMFDVRLVVSRVIAYIVTIGVIAAVYTLFIFSIAAQVASLSQLGFRQILLLAIPTIFVGLTFHRIQQYIDRVTQKIFYRDAYDLRDSLDRLTDVLIGRNDIGGLMDGSTDIFSDTLKPMAMHLVVFNASGIVYKDVARGTEHKVDTGTYLRHIRSYDNPLTEIDHVRDRNIAERMTNDQIEIVLRLGSAKSPVGMLLLGPKKNGTLYNSKDISLLTIGAKGLSIALDNAKKFEQIIHFADTLHKEVNRATTRLRKANKELKTLDALKDDFISTASHQLRTPSASVHDALRMLNSPSLNAEDRKELLVLAEGSSEHLVTVVRTMLNMARLQAGHFTIDRSETDIVDLTEKVIDQVRVLATQKGTTITFSKPEKPLRLFVDVAKISEALSNYIENAIKYSPDGSTIQVSVNSDGKQLRIEVADQGIGVPEDERHQLFTKFYRATNARQEQPDGNGIGLYVVDSIAKGHGGEAYYRPGSSGGSVFGVHIPIAENTLKPGA